MPIDPDQIRVDLLRIKRKLYISYPEGSKERKDFMLAAKMSELSYLQHLVTPDMIDIVYEEYNKIFKAEIINIIISVGIGSCFSVILLVFHQLHPSNLWFAPWYVPGIVGLFSASTHIYHMILNWQRLQPFNKDYQILQAKIETVLNDIKKLTQ